MIDSVTIHGVATYKDKEQVFGPLSAFNFGFGCNGSGKTTLARIIADPDSHPTCKVNWKRDPLLTLVYDRSFVANNFREELRGVFTLGAKDIDLKDRIEKAKQECTKTQEHIKNLRVQIDGNGTDIGERMRLRNSISQFEEKCFSLKQAYYKKFEKEMAGNVGSQARFAAKILQEFGSNEAELLSIDELEAKHSKLYGAVLTKQNPIKGLNIEEVDSIGDHSVFSKIVIGKSDVSISSLIAFLGNSDWVDQGREYLAKLDDQCPFCQQSTPKDFHRDIEEYFDKEFSEDTTIIENLLGKYQSLSNRLLSDIDSLLATPSEFFKRDDVAKEKQVIEGVIKANYLRIESKRREPSRIVRLDSLKDACITLSALIEEANALIVEHNEVVASLVSNQKQLVAEVWRYLVEKANEDGRIPKFITAKENAESKISGIEAKIELGERQLKDQIAQLHALEKTATSVKPTIKDINDILESFGFKGFKLQEGSSPNTYQIVRPDGQPANETLSEGEKTFITFLYFYHMIRGSHSDSGTLEDRVVVFDDPVSSLDSNILFIVSSLLRRLMRVVHDGCEIKQLIVLTHNVFFHKEVSIQRSRQTFGDRRFWVIRKNGGNSVIEPHSNKNPVKSSYERLWAGLQCCDGSPESLQSLQNSMRRILENYFTILGGVDLSALDEMFLGQDKLLCRSLVAWVHDGSHTIHDDLYMSDSDISAEMFLDVFKRIFDKLNHSAHYEMMMGGKLAVPASIS